MRGRIERIWENKTKRGNRYWIISINGKRYTIWDKELLKGLSVGDVVELSWTRSGRFMNVNKIIRLSDDQDKIMQIIRMSCLRSAVELMSGAKRPRPDTVLKIAKQFEDYVLNIRVRS
jgi:hypothetical protein